MNTCQRGIDGPLTAGSGDKAGGHDRREEARYGEHAGEEANAEVAVTSKKCSAEEPPDDSRYAYAIIEAERTTVLRAVGAWTSVYATPRGKLTRLEKAEESAAPLRVSVNSVPMNNAAGRKKKRITIGLDLGDRRHTYCVLEESGKVVREGTLGNTREQLATMARSYPGATAVMEAGMHSPWVSCFLQKLGLSSDRGQSEKDTRNLPE